MSEAVGIHAHPTLKIGARPNDPDRPRIRFSDIRSGGASILTGPIVPTAVDDTKGVAYGLDHNDEFGVCVPTGLDNFRRTVTKLLNGAQTSTSWEQIVAWYQEQNPGFNPNAKPDPQTGEVPNDGGMNIQEFLEARVKDGTIIAFASVDQDDEDQVKEAVWLFLAIILGVDLQTAQQDQTNAKPPVWDYKRSGEWGGHCVMEPAFEANGDEDVISWNMRVKMTPKFVKSQRTEAWVVVLREHLNHPTFRQGIDVNKLSSEFKRLTNKTLDIPPAPEPTPPAPSPVPTNDATDAALWTIAEPWVLNHRHTGEAREVANALNTWASAKGLETAAASS